MNPPIFWSWARGPHWPKRMAPVALLRADERQCRTARVGHVAANVGEIFEEPEEGECKAGGFPLPEEVDGAEERHQQLTEGSAKNRDGAAKPTEEEMATFVNDQIDVIEDEKSGTVSEGIEKEKSVEAEPADSGTAGDGLPVAEFFFEKGHWGKRSKRHAGGKVLARFSQKEFSNRILVS